MKNLHPYESFPLNSLPSYTPLRLNESGVEAGACPFIEKIL